MPARRACTQQPYVGPPNRSVGPETAKVGEENEVGIRHDGRETVRLSHRVGRGNTRR